MIIKKVWVNENCRKRHNNKKIEMHGWFLFGFIPLYIREHKTLSN